MENSFALRFGLLVLGGVVIAAVYVFGTRRARNRKRFRNQGRVSSINPVDVISAQQSAEEKSQIFLDDEPVDAPTHEPPELRREEPAIGGMPESLEQLPKLKKEPAVRKRVTGRRAKKNITQMELGFDDKAGSAEADEGERTESLLTLYVLPPKQQSFTGELIVQALNGVGLKFGDMDIFHHFGAGRLKTEEPLFSVANMLEPGTFDINNIERFSSPGLVFFLQLPAVLDGAVSFELFLNTAQRLTEALDGELFADPNTPLDSMLIEEMRKIAAQH